MNTMNLPKILAWIAHPVISFSGFLVAYAYLLSPPDNQVYYRYALYSFFTVVLLMESRVLIGVRNKRDGIFYIHLMSGICLMILLGILGFRYTSALLEVESVIFSGLSIATGLYLLHRKP